MIICLKLNFINYKIGWVSVIDYNKDRINDYNFIFKLVILFFFIVWYSGKKGGEIWSNIIFLIYVYKKYLKIVLVLI